MANVYIHVGTPKTGTSAIQAFCSKNRKVLKSKGFLYPNMGFQFPGIGVNRNGHFMNRREKDENNNRLPEVEAANVQKGLEKISNHLQKYSNIILSDEQFWNNKEMDTKKLCEYKEKFAQMGAELKLIVYLRRQDLLIQSYWAQQVKETMTMPFDEYISKGKYAYFKVDYYKRLKEMEEAVGKDNIIVRVYEKQQYYGGNIVSDFLHIFGLEVTEEFTNPESVVNLSLEGKFLEAKRILNHDPVYKSKQNFMVPLLTQIQKEEAESGTLKKQIYFSKEGQEEFLKQFEEGNSAIAKEYLDREDGVLFKDEISFANGEEKTEYTKKELILLLGKVIENQQKIIEEKNTKIAELKKPAKTLSSVVKKIINKD